MAWEENVTTETNTAAIPLPADPASAGGERRTDGHLLQIRDLIYKVAGIYQADDKLEFMEERVGRRMRSRKTANTSEYYDLLTVKGDRDAELKELLNEITVGETRLFRSPPMLESLKNSVLPELTQIKSHMTQRKLRIWCAGCSTGEEAYTLGMILAEEFHEKYAGWTFDLTATDLNERSLAAAKDGIYSEASLGDTPEYFREKYFEPAGEGVQVKAELKARVAFTRLNLADETKMLFMKGMNLITCCNVMIYFDANSKRRAVQHFYSNLLPGGYFFLGQSESLYGIQNDFRLVHFPQTTAYFKPGQTPILKGR